MTTHLPVVLINTNEHVDGRATVDMRKNFIDRMRYKLDGFKQWLFSLYLHFVSFVTKFVPEKYRERDSEDKYSRPLWAAKMEAYLRRNKKMVRWFFWGALASIIISALSYASPMVSDMYNDNDMVIELNLLPPEKVERYVNMYRETNQLESHTVRNTDHVKYNPRQSNDEDNDEDNDDNGAESAPSKQPIAQVKQPSDFALVGSTDVPQICGQVKDFQTFWATDKLFCYDVIKYLLDSKYNKPAKKKKSANKEEFTCLCSDYFGLDMDFVYMGYEGKDAVMLISPNISQVKDKDVPVATTNMGQKGKVAETHNALAKYTNTEGGLSHPTVIKASYYSPPGLEQLQAAYPWAADVVKGVNNLKFNDVYGVSTGVKMFDWLLTTVRFFDSLVNQDRKEQYAVSGFMSERIKRALDDAHVKGTRAAPKGYLDWAIKSSFNKGNPRALTKTKDQVFEFPHSSCIAHCKRLRQTIKKL